MQISTKLKLGYKILHCVKSLEQLIIDVTKLIINNTPEDLHERILQKIENLNFDIYLNGQSSEFDDKTNTVFISSNYVADANVYLHEIMHAIGIEKNASVVNIGLSQKFNISINKEKNLLINIGYGVNEGLNQHYTETFIKTYAPISQVSVEYSYCANLMSNLEKLLDTNDLKMAHFSGNGLPSFVNQVVKKCYLPNENKVLKFILQIDAFKTIARTHSVFGATYSADMRYSLVAAYKTLITIALMQAKHLKKEIVFSDVISFEHLDKENLTYLNKYIINDLIKYFYKEKEHILNDKLSNFEGVTYKELLKNMHNIYLNYLNNSNFNGNGILDQLKCGEFYNHVLLSGTITDTDGESKLICTSDFQKDLTIAIFNENNNMLPKHTSEMVQLITQILSSRTVVRCGAEIDDKYIFEATADEEFNKYLMDAMPQYYRDNFNFVDYSAKTNIELIEKMLKEVFLQRTQLYKFKKLMPKELLERQDIKQLLNKYKVDEKISVNLKCEK